MNVQFEVLYYVGLDLKMTRILTSASICTQNQTKSIIFWLHFGLTPSSNEKGNYFPRQNMNVSNALYHFFQISTKTSLTTFLISMMDKFPLIKGAILVTCRHLLSMKISSSARFSQALSWRNKFWCRLPLKPL